jgi:hypothetical protein
MSETELDRVLSGDCDLGSVESKRSIRSAPDSELFDSTRFERIVAELSLSESRTDALAILTSKLKSKKDLEIVARKLDIPIIKSEKAEALQEKIIEATAGSRLRSKAIQGKL